MTYFSFVTEKLVALLTVHLQYCKASKRLLGEVAKDDVTERDVGQRQRVQIVPRQSSGGSISGLQQCKAEAEWNR
ncbi:hypothetical protein AAVH_13887 [Aphelenchoides avenae]|nr:hypothetical protein AAVH_13887 [Aphelenchus avenae]